MYARCGMHPPEKVESLDMKTSTRAATTFAAPDRQAVEPNSGHGLLFGCLGLLAISGRYRRRGSPSRRSAPRSSRAAELRSRRSWAYSLCS